MSLWEYKVITSGRGGFATPALLEKFLNDLGKDEWEIIEFRAQPDNALAFSGLARRTTQRDWTLEDAAAAAARNEADKLRAEFEAKFKGAGVSGAAEEKPADPAAEKPAADDGLRRLRDTGSDLDPDAPDEEPRDEWDRLGVGDELPTFFEAIHPHLRRNQRGPGMSVGVDQLAKKWEFSEEDIKGALTECGFVIPDNEDSRPVYLEYDGDLYWLNINRRGELWINTKEKPRPLFRTVAATRVTPEEPPEATEGSGEKLTAPPSAPAPAAVSLPSESPPASLPEGPALLEKIRPLMRRNRRGPGGSGSTSFLSRALRCSEAGLISAFMALGLAEAAAHGDKPVFVEIGDSVWWLNKDQRGGVWINGREKSEGGAPEPEPGLPPESTATPVPAPASGNIFAAVRLLLQETKTGSFSGEVGSLARTLGREQEEFIAALAGAGLAVPEKARAKPVFAEHAGEIFWLNKNARDELWLNAKASKFPGQQDGDRKSRRPPARKKVA